MKKTLLIITGIILLLAIISFFLFFERPTTQKITILHTNDMHGGFLPSEATWIKETPRPLIGGFLALNYYVKQLRNAASTSLLLDGGDLMTGDLICDIDYEHTKGGALIHFMNQIGYEGMTIGNHEFDVSQENLKKLIQLAKFPVFSANLYTTSGQLFAPAEYQIYQKNGLKIGVIGIITEELFDVLALDKRKGLELKPAVPAIQKIVDLIDPQTDLIVILSHSGFKEDSLLAKQLNHQVDVIIGGHSHTRLPRPREVNGIIIVQAGSKCRDLGKLELEVVGDTVKSYSGELVPLWTKDITPDPKLNLEIEAYRKLIEERYGQVIGQLETDLVRSNNEESNIGNFLADCLKEYTKSDFGIINSGGIRKNLSTGPISIRDVKEILPFENYICTFQCNGSQLMEILKINAQRAALKSGGILQVSGISYQWKANSGNDVTITNAMINGQKIEPQNKYTGATVDFIAVSNAESHLGFIPTTILNTSILFSDAVQELIQQKKAVHAKVEGRIQRLR
ncbi:bifunctional metallophosphatase/5'-nucleotidase [candidate division KSB1 bacterium]|nr:bifunctional metallophosphatase/5'-nucleotidase [candidate division KSB1 bacterium]